MFIQVNPARLHHQIKVVDGLDDFRAVLHVRKIGVELHIQFRVARLKRYGPTPHQPMIDMLANAQRGVQRLSIGDERLGKGVFWQPVLQPVKRVYFARLL